MAVRYSTVQYVPEVRAVGAISGQQSAYSGQQSAYSGQQAGFSGQAAGSSGAGVEGIYTGMRQAQAFLQLVQGQQSVVSGQQSAVSGQQPAGGNALPWRNFTPDPGQPGGTPPAQGVLGINEDVNNRRTYIFDPKALGDWGQGPGGGGKYGPNWNGGNINPPAGSYGGQTLSDWYNRFGKVLNPDGSPATRGGWLMRRWGMEPPGGGWAGNGGYEYVGAAPRWWANMVNWRIGQE